jgi:hypothetical protein
MNYLIKGRSVVDVLKEIGFTTHDVVSAEGAASGAAALSCRVIASHAAMYDSLFLKAQVTKLSHCLI